MKRFIFLLLTCSIFITQCKPAEQKVTNAEAIKFADDMEMAALKHRPDLITSNIILQALTDRIGKEKDIKNINAIEKGMQEGLKNSEFDKNIYGILGKTGTFEKVKVYEKNGIQRIIFRAYGDEGFNYLDMELTKLNDKVGIADMLSYSSGENISKSMAELFNQMMEGTTDKQAEEAVENMQTIKRLMAKGNYKQAKKEFDLLPSRLKNTKIADVIGIQIASNLEEDVYMKEIEKFEIKYAGEPYLQLTMIDLYFLRKDYDKTLSAINQVDALINKDSFLDYYRGLLYNAKGDDDKAIEHYTKVIKSNPDFPGAYAELMAHYLEKDDKDKAKLYFAQYKSLRNAKDDIISSYEEVYPFLKE